MSSKRLQRTYTVEYKVQAIQLAKEIGTKSAATELNVPVVGSALCPVNTFLYNLEVFVTSYKFT